MAYQVGIAGEVNKEPTPPAPWQIKIENINFKILVPFIFLFYQKIANLATKVLVLPWVKLTTCQNSRFLSTNVVEICDSGDGTILELGF